MPKDPRKRQKQLERRKAKEKSRKRAALARAPGSGALALQRAASAPILECCTTDILWTQGMSHLLVSRALSNGAVAFTAFLLDVYCLGVKDLFFNVVSRSEYETLRSQMFRKHKIVKLRPEAARKLVEGAVEYASGLGLSPHPDYRKGRRIFGEIDASLCEEQFTYGKDGKPFFISGPHDSPSRCRQIIDTLTISCGCGRFDYLVGVGGADELPGIFELIE